MDRRNFIKAVGSTLALLPVAGLVAEETAKTAEFFHSEWEWTPFSLAPKPWTIIYYRKDHNSEWSYRETIDCRDQNECSGICYLKDGDEIYSTGFDPRTGCMDYTPEQFEEKFSHLA